MRLEGCVDRLLVLVQVLQALQLPFALRIAPRQQLVGEHKMLHLLLLFVHQHLSAFHRELLLLLSVSYTAPSLLLEPVKSNKLDYKSFLSLIYM